MNQVSTISLQLAGGIHSVYQYPPSSPSSSSSSGSVFSADSGSSQSSESSVGSAPGSYEDAWQNSAGGSHCDEQFKVYQPPTSIPVHPRLHPRRCSISSQSSRPPPSLLRQSEKKGQFVDNLVDCSTRMVEVIWPLSMPACHREQGQGVLPLRTFIQETLRRSKTSFSTLQVALYYLLLIKAFVPKFDFTMEQPEDCPAVRALQCGRRMFLAALILASKYLQDRNYSARAWSKISGLKVHEINTNEMAFLAAVEWKLHIPDRIFDRWQTVLIHYTSPSFGSMWKDAVMALSPQLDDVPPLSASISGGKWFDWGCHRAITSRQSSTDSVNYSPPSPTSISPPSVLEPTPMLPPPSLARPRLLPTPTMTPQTSVYNTPAVGLANYKQSAMCSAMSLAQNASIARDCSVPSRPFGLEAYRTSRRSSLADVTDSSRSSPERCDTPCSLISDHSSQFSRSSSISSASSISPTSSKALARLAAYNSVCVEMPMKSSSHYESDQVTILGTGPLCAEPSSSPEFENVHVFDSEKSSQVFIQSYEQDPSRSGRKRGRSSVDHALQQQVRGLLVAQRPTGPQVETPTPLRYYRSSMALQSHEELLPEARLAMDMQLARKRACITPERTRSDHYTQTMRPEGGPGMWEGIL